MAAVRVPLSGMTRAPDTGERACDLFTGMYGRFSNVIFFIITWLDT
jgi:hypothetical protein